MLRCNHFITDDSNRTHSLCLLQVSVPNGAPAKAKTGPVPRKYDLAFQYLWNAEHIWSKVRVLCAHSTQQDHRSMFYIMFCCLSLWGPV